MTHSRPVFVSKTAGSALRISPSNAAYTKLTPFSPPHPSQAQ